VFCISLCLFKNVSEKLALAHGNAVLLFAGMALQAKFG